MRDKIVVLLLAVAIIASMVIVGCVKPVAPPEEPVTPPEEPAEEPTGPPLPARIIYAPSVGPGASQYPMCVKIGELGDAGMPETGVTQIYVGGTTAAMEALYNGESDIGGVGIDQVYQMIHGQAAWEGKPKENRLRILFNHSSGTKAACVRADSDFHYIHDLSGCSIYFSLPGSSMHATMPRVLEIIGVTGHESMVCEIADAVAAFKDGRLDCYIKSVAGHNIDAQHIDIMTATPIRFIGYTPEEVEKIRADPEGIVDYINWVEYPAGWFTALPDNEAVIQQTYFNTTGCRVDFPEELAYQFTKGAIDNWQELPPLYVGADMDPLETIKFLREGVYMHPGAIRYFREQGVEIPESAIPPEMMK